MSQDYGTPEDRLDEPLKPWQERQRACPHKRVTRHGNGHPVEWYCSECELAFWPEGKDPELLKSEATFSMALDAIAGTMSAVLFDYSERMNERYGLRPDVVRTDDTHEQSCEDLGGHNIDPQNGTCIRCDHSPFLGN